MGRSYPVADPVDAHLNWQTIAVRHAWKKATQGDFEGLGEADADGGPGPSSFSPTGDGAGPRLATAEHPFADAQAVTGVRHCSQLPAPGRGQHEGGMGGLSGQAAAAAAAVALHARKEAAVAGLLAEPPMLLGDEDDPGQASQLYT